MSIKAQFIQKLKINEKNVTIIIIVNLIDFQRLIQSILMLLDN